MNHPTTCFAVTKHHSIIPLKVTNVEDLGDDCYDYTVIINSSNPSPYMIAQHKAFFKGGIFSKEKPFCGQYTSVRETLGEAVELANKLLEERKAELLREIESINLRVCNLKPESEHIQELMKIDPEN